MKPKLEGPMIKKGEAQKEEIKGESKEETKFNESITEEKIKDEIVKLFSSNKNEITTAVWNLVKVGEKAVPHLLKLLKSTAEEGKEDKRKEERREKEKGEKKGNREINIEAIKAAIFALGKIGSKNAIPTLIPFLVKSGYEVSAQAALINIAFLSRPLGMNELNKNYHELKKLLRKAKLKLNTIEKEKIKHLMESLNKVILEASKKIKEEEEEERKKRLIELEKKNKEKFKEDKGGRNENVIKQKKIEKKEGIIERIRIKIKR